jgi:L-ornithine N5-monooxygenase
MRPVSESRKSQVAARINGSSYETSDALESSPTLPSYLPGLNATGPDGIHDLVCVGFGPASLAIAVALHDLQDPGLDEHLTNMSPKVRFLERQAGFYWHAGMLLPGAKMQISFIKDLATLRDPCSHFTFLNYLKLHDRLVQFSNLDTFLPSRLEFEDYLRWSAEHFAHLVDYGQEVSHITPIRKEDPQKCDCLEVRSKDLTTGEVTTKVAKNVVIAAGGRPSKPNTLPEYHTRILHSSEYSTRIKQILPVKDKPYQVAVIGSGQSAAEVFNDLHTRYPNSCTRIIFRDTALRPSDDSPFVNEVFNPEAVDTFFDQPDDMRSKTLEKNKATNYSVVRLELLEKIYEDQYMQSVQEPNKELWQHQILPSRDIVDFVDLPEQGPIKLILKSLDYPSKTEALPFDAVILATGYRRNAHLDMLEDCQELNPSKDGRWQTGRDYALKLDRSLVADDVGIWVQGANEGTHGLADSLLSILATRSGELVHSIFGVGGKLGGH